MTNGNGTPPEAAQAPQLNVLAQYTKDLSFENPNAPSSLQQQSQPPQINIQINVGANNLNENEYEVTLSVEGKAENGGKIIRRHGRSLNRPHGREIAFGNWPWALRCGPPSAPQQASERPEEENLPSIDLSVHAAASRRGRVRHCTLGTVARRLRVRN